MGAHLELWVNGAASLVPLGSAEVSVGRGESNDVPLAFDPTVSRLHAVIVPYRGGWCIRDVGSANGTFLNGQRLLSEQVLRPNDEIRVGTARLLFRSDSRDGSNETVQATGRAPAVTKRERDVLRALCRPLLEAHAFAQPAPTQRIARELVIGEAAVKFHLGHLYDKFGIPVGEGSRRATLANEAIKLGVISRGDLAD